MTPLEFCEKYLENYRINSDGTIDVDGNVFLYRELGNMEKLPVKFGKVSGYFYCSSNILTTLEGCPYYVGAYFNCDGNKLTTLEGCPDYVDDGNFYCYGNNLTTLEGCPKYVGGDLVCEIITHHILGNVQRNIYCNNIQRIVI
jgi:hypothetical protein